MSGGHVQWPRSPRNHPKNPRFSNSVSAVGLRPRCPAIRTLGCITAPPPRASSASAPTRSLPPASKARHPLILRPALTASSRQRCSRPTPCTRLQLLAWLALNAGKHTGNQPTRLAHLDDGNDRAILVQGDEGPAQVVRLGHQGTPSVGYSDDGAISSPPAPYHLSGGGRWIRTIGPPATVARRVREATLATPPFRAGGVVAPAGPQIHRGQSPLCLLGQRSRSLGRIGIGRAKIADESGIR